MTKAQALKVLEGIEGAERLLQSIRSGPSALDQRTEEEVKRVIEDANLRSEYHSPRPEIVKASRTRGRQVKYPWDR